MTKVFTLLWILAALSQSAGAQLLLPLQESEKNTIGYKTVDEALTALREKPGVEISDNHGWTIATDRDAMTIWSFAPKGHPAFPSAVKRTIIEHDGGVFTNMSVLCQSSKSACDQLVVEFNHLNDRMRASMGKKPN